MFTYGGPGYGTLQEYLVVDHYLPEIQPDLIVLQTSLNDFINNSWELESSSYINNNFARRPYLQDTGRIVYRFPSRWRYAGPLLAQSRLIFELALNTSRLGATFAYKGWLHSIEDDLNEGRSADLQRTFATTERIISMLKARAGSTPVVAFAADSDLYFPPIFERQHIPFFVGVPAAIKIEEHQLGASVRPDGAHWDARGHHVAGAVLARWLADSVLLKK